MKKISVITVTYNAKEMLEETIKNVLSFDKDLIDMIVVDGSSSDGTKDLLEQYNGRLKCWVSEVDNGIYDAMNKGWKLAAEDSVVLFLGAGDKLINLPANINNDAITFGKVLIGERTTFVSKVNNLLKSANTLHHQALLVPKKLHRKPPFDLRYDIYADFDFNQRLYKNGFTFLKDDSFTSYALPGGVSEHLDKYQMVKISYKNFGVYFALVSWLNCTYCEIVTKFKRGLGISSSQK